MGVRVGRWAAPSQVGFELGSFCGAAGEGRKVQVHVSTGRTKKRRQNPVCRKVGEVTGSFSCGLSH